MIYAAVNNDGDINTAINNSSDPNLLLVGLLSTFPVHFITLAVVWLTVTNAGKYSFWKTLGWNWGKNFSFWKSVIIAVVFYLLAVLLVSLFGETENDLMRVLRSSRAAVYATAFLATFTAPLVEETVYRGMMYSAFRRNFGNWAAIALVTVLFALIHVPQYYPSYGVILAILLLSFVLSIVRAYSGNLLPCVVIHTVFNGIQAIMLILEPFIMKTSAPPAEPAVFTLPFFFK